METNQTEKSSWLIDIRIPKVDPHLLREAALEWDIGDKERQEFAVGIVRDWLEERGEDPKWAERLVCMEAVITRPLNYGNMMRKSQEYILSKYGLPPNLLTPHDPALLSVLHEGSSPDQKIGLDVQDDGD